MSLKKEIDQDKVPGHVAIIMDGNGRWANLMGKPRLFGHQNGVQSVREALEAAGEVGIKCLTLYAFSTENWKRPAYEVNALMSLLVQTVRKEIDSLMKNEVQLCAIGDIDKLPSKSRKALQEGIERTKDNQRIKLVLALNYSARWDIANAARKIADDYKENNLDTQQIGQQEFDSYLSTSGLPEVELVIRTSGEFRISNFLLWEIAYAELYFTDKYWPEFRKEDFFEAILNFQNRERRFGLTGDQLRSLPDK